MRRARPGFAWVSMMDLLFGLFGALVILTVLVTLKLGRDSGIEEKAFQLVTFDVSAEDADVNAALARMAINFELLPAGGGDPCFFGASFRSDVCEDQLAARLEGAPVLFTTGVVETHATQSLSATLFAGAAGSLQLRPFLSNVPALMDLDTSLDVESVRVRVHVKIGDAFWAPDAFCTTVSELISRAETDERGMAHLDLCAMTCGAATAPCDNILLKDEGGSVVVH